MIRETAHLRTATRPEVPAFVLTTVGVLAVILPYPTLMWIVAGIAAGYSLSGST
jgi:hypothetical protein